MNAAITTAFARAGLDLPTCDCPRCKGVLHRDDMMGGGFSDELTLAILERYGRTICFECADEHTVCECCGAATDEPNENAECPGCAGTLAREWTLDAEHERTERRKLR